MVTKRGKVIHILGAPRIFRPVVRRDVVADAVIPTPENTASAAVVTMLLGESNVQRWGDYLTGTFALVVHDPETRTCTIITDLGNSCHLFAHLNAQEQVYRCTNDVDVLAHDAGATDLDIVSFVEYLAQASITYPYTAYRNLEEVPFASCTRIMYSGTSLQVRTDAYWQPQTEDARAHPEELARTLREGLLAAAEDIVRGKHRIGIFLSGGTDSRVIAGILAELGVCAHAMTIVDVPNVESQIAAAVATANGHTHEVLCRDLEYYPRNTDGTLRVDGPHTTLLKGMYIGFRDTIAAHGFDAIFGGYMSDTLLKLHEANVVGRRLFGRHLGTLEVFDRTNERSLRGGAEYLRRFSSLFDSDLLAMMTARRVALLAWWRELRRDGSAWEWSYFWPFMRSQYNHNLTMNIATYPSYELFTDRRIIEVARVAPQQWKINGRLFIRAVSPFLRSTARIPLASTRLRIRGSPVVNEFLTAAKHLLPRRWMFRDNLAPRAENPIATNGSFPDTEALWQTSRMLATFRAEYEPTIEARIMRSQVFGPFDVRRYRELSFTQAQHIMYALLTYDRWRRLCVRRFDRVPVHAVARTPASV